MTNQENPTPSKKTNPTVWVVVGIAAVLVVCLLLAATLVGTYFYLQRTGRLGSVTSGIPFLSKPGPKTTSTPMAVEAFDPSNSKYPALPNLVPGWKGLTQPGIQDWHASVSANQPVLIMLGWCTTTKDILDQNDQQIKWSLNVDGQDVDVTKLFIYNQQLPDRICLSGVGVIRQWSVGTHTITTKMTTLQKINDGWDDYPAGDYTDVYTVKVK